jgi:hypothetical protein
MRNLDNVGYKVVSATVAGVASGVGPSCQHVQKQSNNDCGIIVVFAYKYIWEAFEEAGEAIMSTPNQKEFGPGYDYPNRKFHFWAVILPTVLITALAVVFMRHTVSPSNTVTRSPVVTCPTQTCPPPGSTDSAKPAQAANETSTPAAGLNAAATTAGELSSPTVTSATDSASSQPSSPSPSSNLSPAKTSPAPSSSASPTATPVLPVLSVTQAMLGQASSAATHAVILSSA